MTNNRVGKILRFEIFQTLILGSIRWQFICSGISLELFSRYNFVLTSINAFYVFFAAFSAIQMYKFRYANLSNLKRETQMVSAGHCLTKGYADSESAAGYLRAILIQIHKL